ncbi:MAG: RNA polymerase sigma factor [Planctomycetota bacterium]
MSESQAAGRARCGPEELALLASFRGGDAEAFPALVRPHLGALQALARRLAGDRQWGEDLVQETLLRAYRALAAFRGDASVRTWLFRIQCRLATEPARWRRGDHAGGAPPADVPDHLGPSPEQGSLQRELRDRLDEAMERLPARQRTALHLRAVEGLDYATIGQVLECSGGAARMLVLAARQRVMERLGRYLEP